jgi:hypothetical protein
VCSALRPAAQRLPLSEAQWQALCGLTARFLSFGQLRVTVAPRRGAGGALAADASDAALQPQWTALNVEMAGVA